MIKYLNYRKSEKFRYAEENIFTQERKNQRKQTFNAESFGYKI